MEKVWDLIIKLRNEKMGLVFFFFFFFFGFWVFFRERGSVIGAGAPRACEEEGSQLCVRVCEIERKNCLVVRFFE